MKNVNRNNITAAVIASFAGAKDARMRELVSRLVEHLHAYAKEVRLTHAEWKAAIDFLYAAGKISDERRNEFILTSDVLGLSSLVDLINNPRGATESSELGPFHAAGSPLLPVGADLKSAHHPVLVKQRVVGAFGVGLE